MNLSRIGRMTWACIGLLLILPILAACGGSSTASAKNNGPAWGFPFKTGTTVTLGSYGLHDDNFSSVPGTNGTYFFAGYDSVKDASLDLLPQGSSVPVIPLASGNVFATWPTCHLVVVDHGGGVLVEYLHINVSVKPGDQVTRDTTLGTTTTSVSTGQPCNEVSEDANGQPVEHVHFAFLTETNAPPPYSATNTVARFETMVGRVLCGHNVAKSAPTSFASEGGAIEGLASGPDQSFTIPDCHSSSGQVLGASTSAPTGTAGSVREFSIPTPNSAPGAITVGGDGNLWFTELSGNKIGRLTPNGQFAEFAIPGNGQPTDITKGPDGNLWFTELEPGQTTGNGGQANEVGRITPTGTITLFPTPSATCCGGWMAITAADGYLWVANGEFIEQLTLDGLVNYDQVVSPQIGSSLATSIITGPDGQVWYASGGSTINQYTGRFESPTSYSLNAANSNSSAAPITTLADGPDGNIWFIGQSTNSIGYMTLSGSFKLFHIPNQKRILMAITAGPDRNVWFTDDVGNMIGRMTPSGELAEFPVPTPDSEPAGITVGPDGALWFTELKGNRIGRMTP